MKKSFDRIVLFTMALMLIGSCTSKKEVVYFQDVAGVVSDNALVNFVPNIQTGDMLFINVSAVDAEAAIPFNLYESPIIGNYYNVKPLTYLVNEDGDINFPVIGNIKVAGLTSKQLTNKLTLALSDYIKEPIINIRWENFKVTVLGEVKNPGSYKVPNEKISIIDAIGLAGDLTIFGNRKNVTLVREKDGKRTFVALDLTNKRLFNSPYFYLSQNDVIYIEPNKTKVNSSRVGPNTGVIISAVSILISIAAILIK